MRVSLVFAVQRIFNMFGYHLSKLERGVRIDDSFEEQLRLAGDVATIFEVGSADGRDTRTYADRCTKAIVHAFEPLPENFTKLRAVAEQEPRIIPVNMAVSSKAGTASFHVAALPDASSLFSARSTGSTFDKYTTEKDVIEVSVITLDGYCERESVNNIDILKMDAQGAELEILKGAENILGSKKIKLIYSEVNFMRIYDGSCLFHEVTAHLEKLNYRLHAIYNQHHNQFGRLAWADAIYLPNID
ncbi:FkbM family methyltransferase [Mesorhizobium sp. WSM2561]|uniref:FkbM family methyltransferase n=1 Tax=Mesorhizobium sp. WSM2561 TaxID=1040985 RepID=UPI000481904B|nr:FkbM family methyltransferase [Mesorhizobium sp. WSM2561]